MDDRDLRNYGRRAFLAGVLAALVMTLAMVVLRVLTELLSLPELIGEGIVRVLPAEIFSRALDTLLFAAKPSLLALILLGQLLVGGALGRLYAATPNLPSALWIAFAAWLILGLVIMPVLQLGFFASALRGGPTGTMTTLGASLVIFALALASFHAWLATPAVEEKEPAQPARRRSLVTLGAGLAVVAIGASGWRAFGNRPGTSRGAAAPPASAPPATGAAEAPTAASSSVAGRNGEFQPRPGTPAGPPFDVAGIAAEVTPTRDFYTVSKNFVDPIVDGKRWSLTIDGLVEQPLILDYDGIKLFPARSDFYTLQCISNPVGGDLWGNAYWTGVPLGELLARARVKPDVRKVIFHGADDYDDSITLDRALHPEALLAYEMNGEVLEKGHGFPARLLIPNIFGMKNVKWITRIELVDYDFKGFWMQRGWSDPAPYLVSSRIDVPEHRANISSGQAALGGVAFAGERGIKLVEYSLDDGQTWQPAELKPRLATNTWQLWTARPQLAPGKYNVKVRAVDGLGALQTQKVAEPLPDGATGYHTVVIVVS